MTEAQVGDQVTKTGGDYRFDGTVVARFAKRSGAVRVVVEDDRGLLFIFNDSMLRITRKARCVNVNGGAAQPDGVVGLRPDQIPDVFPIGRTTVFRLIKSGQLESVKVGRARIVPIESLHRYMRRLLAEQGAKAQ